MESTDNIHHEKQLYAPYGGEMSNVVKGGRIAAALLTIGTATVPGPSNFVAYQDLMEPTRVTSSADVPEAPQGLTARELVLQESMNTESRLLESAGYSGMAFSHGWLAQALAEMKTFSQLTAGWDGYSAAPPSVLAMRQAECFLKAASAQVLKLDRVAPSVIGGVGATFEQSSKMAYVEFYNDGRILALLDDGAAPADVRDVQADDDGFVALAEGIRGMLHG